MTNTIVFTGDSTVSLHRVPATVWEALEARFTVTRFADAQWIEAFGEPGTLVVFGPGASPCDCCGRPVWADRDGLIRDASGPHTCPVPK